jgi:hypothetical protein
MLSDNCAQYDRDKSRGVPRPGKALLQGIIYCGECGHKMSVHYKTGTKYLCHYLRRHYDACKGRIESVAAGGRKTEHPIPTLPSTRGPV